MPRLSMALAFGLILLAVSVRPPTEETFAAQSRQVPAGTRHTGRYELLDAAQRQQAR